MYKHFLYNEQLPAIKKAFKERLKDIQFEKRGYKLDVDDIEFEDLDKNEFIKHNLERNFDEIERAKENKKTHYITTKLKVVIKDKDNNIVNYFDKKIKVPFITFLNSFLIKGNLYAPVSQIRRKPGFYVSKKENGKVVGLFNIANKKNFKIELEHDGNVIISLGTKKVNLKDFEKILNAKFDYGDLKDMQKEGIEDEEKILRKVVEFFKGKEIAQSSKKQELYKHLEEYFEDAKIWHDNNKTEENLPNDLKWHNLKHYIQYFLDVANNKKEEVEPNNLKHKEILNTYELMAERLKYFIRDGKLGVKLRKMLKSNKFEASKLDFTTPLYTIFYGTGLSVPIQKVNIIDFANNLHKVVYTGEGGINNPQNTDDHLRLIDDTDFGILDLYYSPSSVKIGLSKHFTIDYNPLKKTMNVIDAKTKTKKEIPYEEFFNSNVMHIKDYNVYYKLKKQK